MKSHRYVQPRPQFLFSRGAVGVQIGVVESSDLREPLEIDDRQFSVLCDDQPVIAQALQRAIDMHRGHSRRVRQFRLSKWQRKCFVAVDHFDDAQAHKVRRTSG